MPTEPELLNSVLASPDDNPPRLAYAAWCDGQADGATRARGEFIRLQIELPALNYGDPAPGQVVDEAARVQLKLDWVRKNERHRELLAAHAATWAAPIQAIAPQWTFDRGFVAGVTLPARTFLEQGARLLQLAPIAKVALTAVADYLPDLLASPLLESLAALDLTGNGLDNSAARPLVRCPYFKKLWWLCLNRNEFDLAGVDVFASSPLFLSLDYLGLKDNPCDPLESVGIDGFSIQDARMTPDGAKLEQRHGYIPWLHYPTDSIADYPPSPFRRRPRAVVIKK